jgi:hypothetical protein
MFIIGMPVLTNVSTMAQVSIIVHYYTSAKVFVKMPVAYFMTS